MKIKSVEVEYLESGTFVGGEEDTSNAGIERDETCYVVSKDTFKFMEECVKKCKALKIE